MRSATAHKIFETDPRFEVKSAGTDKNANNVLTTDLMNWAEVIVVMEKSHRNFIRSKHPVYYDEEDCLFIYP